MVRKVVVINFANGNLKAINRITDISEAVAHAEKNLLIKHGIAVMGLYDTKNKLVLELGIPDEISENFTPGRHLRGISKYLLNKNEKYYKYFLVGTRLLHYNVYPSFAELGE